MTKSVMRNDSSSGSLEGNVLTLVTVVALLVGFYCCARYVLCPSRFEDPEVFRQTDPRIRFFGRWPRSHFGVARRRHRHHRRHHHLEEPMLSEEQLDSCASQDRHNAHFQSRSLNAEPVV